VHRRRAHIPSAFWAFNFAVWIGKNDPAAGRPTTVHDGGAVILAVLVAGHIAAALKHRFIDRDAVMQRMTPKLQTC